MLKPLKKIFDGKIFENPSHDKYAWVGAEKAHVMLFNDFRWCREVISWNDLSLLLEGETVNLPAPKNTYAHDVRITTDVAIFATSKCTVEYKGSYNSTDSTETEMMSVRWKTFYFKHRFEEHEQKSVEACAKCFADLVFT